MTKHKLLEDLKSHFETIGAIRNLAQECSQELIDFLLKDSQYSNEYKSRFFLESAGMLVFKQLDFLTFLDLKNLGGSFTSYASKIGLSSKTRGLLKASNEIVLSFAYKDGVLKGGQSRDEKKQDEIFFNEILAKDEIDALFEPKALQNFEVIGNGNLSQLVAEESNILLKGNNLLALHSLKKKYRGKVKLIYIDPPYNTGSDSFKYNDKFNHSTWLTFMKNRLEIAREFLRDDGVIFVQCDNSPSSLNESPEMPYLGVLLDEIFGRKNYVSILTWKKKGNASNTIANGIGTITESIFMYAKNLENVDINLLGFKRKYSFSDEKGEYNLELPIKTNDGEYERSTMVYSITIEGKVIFPPRNKRWTIGKETMDEIIKCGKFELIDDKFYIKKYEKDYIRGNATLYNNLLLEFGSLKSAKEELKKLGFDREAFSSPKPEPLLRRIIEISTNKNDLVMDFFAGSGTTLAVAHKMGRKWIGIEQMDYIQDITKERLRKVIDGEQGGISKVAEWKGGGSFIYAELMPFNAIYRERIEASQDEKELETIYKDLEEKAFLDYRVDLQEILADQDFKNMSLEDKKETLRLILDENMDYVPLGDIEDKTYGIDEDTIRLNKMFYGEEQ